MVYPPEHKYGDEILDLAFTVTSGDSPAQHDLGDAPDSSNNLAGVAMTAYPDGTVAGFPTAYHAGSPPYGPIHRYPRDRFHLGKWVSLETEADIGADDDAVNNLGPQNDVANRDGGDDGLQLPVVMPPCGETTLRYTVTVTNPGAQQGYVNVWCDWNRDGDWDDIIACPDGNEIPEWVVQNQQAALCGPGTCSMATPSFRCWHPRADEIDPLWLRITIAEQRWQPDSADGTGGAGPAGGYLYGETEDYYIRPQGKPMPTQFDWGDAPGDGVPIHYPTTEADNGARHAIAGPWLGDESSRPDAEEDGQPHVKALGDNNAGSNDESGVSIPPLVQGQLTSATIEVSGGGGVVQAWIDFNGDLAWRDSEKIFDRFLPDGIHTIPFRVPQDATTGWTFARFRISRSGGLAPFGAASDGEVEDHAISIDPLPDAKRWCQLPDPTPQGVSIRVDSNDYQRRVMADDFECRSPGRLTHVRLWGSWKDDRRGTIGRIRLRIHSDDPAGSAGADKKNLYSKPAPEILWEREFATDQFAEVLYHTAHIAGLWWWDPACGESIPGCNALIWQIDIDADTSGAFVQEGSSGAPRIYWLVVETETINGQFGWNTRQWPEHFGGDAVRDASPMPPSAWYESYYPCEHAYYDVERNSVDMAFCLLFEQDSPVPTCQPTASTQCPAIETACPASATQCPVVQTCCPPGVTTCPAAVTACPPLETVCPTVRTQCKAMPTQCPPVETLCPHTHTQCPVFETVCPPTETQCPTWPTLCPPVETTCPIVRADP
jgi:hypothetical protein